ncbi:thyrotropin-releasing hormone receptor-like [Physella acuta]|uniref:thyrotropin-releasing hormone receptor-like n=1 Tax=Physella acuta TaxID=109671 RepID=UPI0027DBAFAE|nr:thyrotropin-releasing hormone receptor-like [Physella acuta]
MNTTLDIYYRLDWEDIDFNTVWNLENSNFTDERGLFCYSTVELENLREATKAFDRYAVPAICGLGFVGGIVSFLIFVATPFRYLPCSHYLALLAVVDMMFLTTQVVNSLVNHFPSLAWATGSCFYVVYTSYVSSFLSAWFLVLMMMERYVIVCHPFKYSYLCSKRTSIISISLTTIVSLIAYSHSFFTLDISNKKSPCVTDPNYIEFLSIFTYADTVVVFVVPFFTIFFLNLRILTAVRKLKKHFDLQNRRLGRVPRLLNRTDVLSLAQMRSTTLLIWVSSVYIVFYLPSYGVRILALINTHITGPRLCEPFFHVMQQLSQILHLLNYAIDIFIYLTTSDVFRKILKVYLNESRCKGCFKKLCAYSLETKHYK